MDRAEEVYIQIRDNGPDLTRCRQAARSAALNAGLTAKDADDVAAAVFEACVNAVTHGRTEDSDFAVLRLRIYEDRLEAVVQDFGCGLDCPGSTEIPLPTAKRGRGIPLMNAFMDEVRFERDDGCKVTLVKRLPPKRK